MKNYKSPISIDLESVMKAISKAIDGRIMEAIRDADIFVNRDELIRTLNYDRNSYDAGYEDGLRDGYNKGYSAGVDAASWGEEMGR